MHSCAVTRTSPGRRARGDVSKLIMRLVFCVLIVCKEYCPRRVSRYCICCQISDLLISGTHASSNSVLSLTIITLPPSPCGAATRTANHFTPLILPSTQPHAVAHLDWHSLGAFRMRILSAILFAKEYRNSRQASFPWTAVNGAQCELLHRNAKNTAVSLVQDIATRL